MENISQVIDGKTFILIEDIVYSEYDFELKRKKAISLGGFVQAVKERKTDWWDGKIKHIKFTVLIPSAAAFIWHK